MKVHDLAAALIATVLAIPVHAAPSVHPDPAGPILMDGTCEDAAWQSAGFHEIGVGARLRFAANEDFVYLCIEAPPESFANVDLYILNDTSVHNLHASAQLGERVKSETGWPDFRWWNHSGWTANWLPYVGRRVDNGRALPPFGFAPGREFQIARSKFPGSEWRLMVHVHELATANGMDGEARYPAHASEDDPNTWARLVMSVAPATSSLGEVR